MASLPSATELSRRAVLLVRLVHAPRADQWSTLIAEARIEIGGRTASRLPFVLEAELRDPVPPGLYVEAELRMAGGSQLEQGDFLSVKAMPRSQHSSELLIVIPLKRIL